MSNTVSKKKKVADVAQPKPRPKALLPQGKMPPIPTFHDHPWRWLIAWRWYYKRRTRLICPCCSVVGTWKPYGGWWRDRNVKRWLCKWCGFYDGVDGRYWCYIDKTQGCWVGWPEPPEEAVSRINSGDLTTPEKIAHREGFNPWAG